MPVPFILHCNVTVTVPPIPLQDWLQSADANVVMGSVLRVTVDGLKWYIRSRVDYSTKFYTESFHPSPGEVLPLYKPYRCVPPQKDFCAVLVWKWVQTLLILVWNRVWFSKELRECTNLFIFFNSKWVRKKEKYANSKWIVRSLFCCCSNLSNDEIIYERPGLRMGNDFRGQVWKRVWKMIFFVRNRVRIWRTGRNFYGL